MGMGIAEEFEYDIDEPVLSGVGRAFEPESSISMEFEAKLLDDPAYREQWVADELESARAYFKDRVFFARRQL